jgi:hypothetical protein
VSGVMSTDRTSFFTKYRRTVFSFSPLSTRAASSGSLYSAAPAMDIIAVSSLQTGP